MTLRSSRARRASFEILEPRQVLSTLQYSAWPVVYPFGTVGPIPTGSHVAATPQANPPGDVGPYGGCSSLAWNSIGAAIISDIYAGGDSVLADVKYTINGGGIAMQTFNTSIALYQETDGTDHNLMPNGAVSDTWNFYWNIVPGTKSVSAVVTYTDCAQWNLAIANSSVTVPAVNNFTVTVPKAAMCNGPGGFGLYNLPVNYSAQVNPGPIQGSNFGFVQLAQLDWYWEDFNGNKMGVNFPSRRSYSEPFVQLVRIITYELPGSDP
jgi:hypothetical protein